jgi:cytosine/adenosine deaminase-related metal-dependent hydrolase
MIRARMKPAKSGVSVATLLVVALAFVLHAFAKPETYDIVISHGRIIDPESGLQAIRNLGIADGKIAAISTDALTGKQTLDATGLVVAPGFIDLHEHGQEPRNYQFQAHDGVTTSLELEAGTNDVAQWYSQREGKSLINFGVSIGHIPVRAQVVGRATGQLGSSLTRAPKVEEALHREASLEQINEMKALIETGMKQGALAEGMGINYTPGATRGEIVEMFRVAAKYSAPVHVHLRYGRPD